MEVPINIEPVACSTTRPLSSTAQDGLYAELFTLQARQYLGSS